MTLTINKKTYEAGELVAYIEKLEKENAELKARPNTINLLTPELEKQSKTKKQQLIKAKELLKKIEKIVYSGENEIKRLSQIVDILAEAEQFLKEK